MVRFFFAALAAFLMFLRAARRCFDDAILVVPQIFIEHERAFTWAALALLLQFSLLTPRPFRRLGRYKTEHTA